MDGRFSEYWMPIEKKKESILLFPVSAGIYSVSNILGSVRDISVYYCAV